MSSTPANSSTPAAPEALPTSLVLLLATGAGLAVASIYYAQPLLGVLGDEFGATADATGWIPTLTQLGYALGILFLSPLGDRYDRRRIILSKTALLILALLGCALAPGLGSLLAASLAVGLCATLAQDIVPAAAALAPEARRGKVVGTVMTGLLLGILLSRVFSGLLGAETGWRSVYTVAALSLLLFGVAAWRGLPRFAPALTASYPALMRSLLTLWRRHAPLRRAAWSQGLLSLAFSAFWSTLALMLHTRYGLGSGAAGAFGLAGAAGALAAPLAGRWADANGPSRVVRLGAGLAALSFALLGLGHGLPQGAQLGLIALAALGFDFGIQAALVAHQTLVYGLEPAARSRLNALLFTGVFVGMAAGSVLGSRLLALWGWPAVAALACTASLAALLLRPRSA